MFTAHGVTAVTRDFHPLDFHKKTTKRTMLGAPRSTPATGDFHRLDFCEKPTKHTMLGAPRSRQEEPSDGSVQPSLPQLFRH